jgi:hypothetical protein
MDVIELRSRGDLPLVSTPPRIDPHCNFLLNEQTHLLDMVAIHEHTC